MTAATSQRRSDTQEIKEMLQSRIDALAYELAPGGDGCRHGIYWMPRNPARGDAQPGSFWIATRGPKVGAWADEATGDGAAQSRNGTWPGDVFGLIAYVHNFTDFKDTIRWARDWLGLERMPEHERQSFAAKARARAEHTAKHASQKEQQTLADKRKYAQASYINGSVALLGSPVDVYLRSRGIDLRGLRRQPGALRYVPIDSKFARHAETDTRWPVMLACMTGIAADGKEEVQAVHRTFLALDGAAKAPVSPARKIWPSFSGAAIRLWRGQSDLSVAEAIKHGVRETLIICEGVEDGLSVALASPEYRVWCAGSLGNIGAIQLPECVDDVVVCADNDWGKPQAEAMLKRGIAALVAQGRTVSIARSHIGKDVNDALRGAA